MEGASTGVHCNVGWEVNSVNGSVVSGNTGEGATDILTNGIWLTGGGALLRGLDKRIAAKTKLKVHIAEDPLRAVVRGTGTALKNIGRFKFLMTA